MASLLQFQPFSSAVDVSFWYELARRKLEIYKLSEAPVPLHGSYNTGDEANMGSLFLLSAESFNDEFADQPRRYEAPGGLHNVNTIEAFRAIDKKALFAQAAERIRADVLSGAAAEDPTLLSRFVLFSFADLKKYSFFYMFGFPALAFPGDAQPQATPPAALSSVPWGEQLAKEYERIRSPRTGVFLVKPPAAGVGAPLRVGRLSQFAEFFPPDQVQAGSVVVGFADPCALPAHPGWPLRNLLFLLAAKWGVRRAHVVCLREGKDAATRSLLLDVTLPPLADGAAGTPVGWEKNAEGKLAPRAVLLQEVMDPVKLASRAANLNLQLMKWRVLPSLDLAALARTKCLLLGAGTLGCNVARNLLAWGVRTITFVDNGRVSFSNPVRQSLFTFEDSLHGGRPKAEAAAERLKAIFPEVAATGHQLSIPMPGHPVPPSDTARVAAAITQLQDLVRAHDVVFLGTDSRESRWLPTVLAAAERKARRERGTGSSCGGPEASPQLVINAALGFDSFLVVRHGLPPSQGQAQGQTRLGCYFCNDVVAPGDCTVTRPGVSAVAATLAVELMVALLHHPLGPAAPADDANKAGDAAQEGLGIIPHQIRGFLSSYSNLLVSAQAYDKCTACSPAVAAEYQRRGAEFLFQAFQQPAYLEDLTGLTALRKDAQAAASIAWDDDDDV